MPLKNKKGLRKLRPLKGLHASLVFIAPVGTTIPSLILAIGILSARIRVTAVRILLATLARIVLIRVVLVSHYLLLTNAEGVRTVITRCASLHVGECEMAEESSESFSFDLSATTAKWAMT